MTVVVHLYRPAEEARCRQLLDLFGPELRLVSVAKPAWLPVDQWWPARPGEMSKRDTGWTRRYLEKFAVGRGTEWLVKVDPDTVFSEPLHRWPADAEAVAESFDLFGDFRKTPDGARLWLGGYQVYTRRAVKAFLRVLPFEKDVLYQDVELAQTARRLRLKAWNAPELNLWRLKGDPEVRVSHRGQGPLKRLPLGLLYL